MFQVVHPWIVLVSIALAQIFLNVRGDDLDIIRANIKKHLSVSNKRSVSQSLPSRVLTHWLFIHYHKTGHDLSHKMVSRLVGRCHLSEAIAPKRQSIFDTSFKAYIDSIDGLPKDVLTTNDIIYSVAGAFAFNWTAAFQHNTHKTRIVHFIRDPFETVLSGYLYHTQEPPPPTEGWMKKPNMSFCPKDVSSVMKLGKILGEHYGNEEVVVNWLQNAVRDCDNLLSSVRKNESDSFLTFLHRASSSQSLMPTQDPAQKNLYPAIRMEAYRALFATDFMGGDLLSMAVNVVFQQPNIARAFHLEDFAIGNETRFRETAQSMFSFLYEIVDTDKGVSHRSACRLCHCVSADEAVSMAVSAAFISGNAPAEQHVTRNMISRDQRLHYIRLLHEDAFIGPVLQFLSKIVNGRMNHRQ